MENSPAVAVNPFTGGDVAGILVERAACGRAITSTTRLVASMLRLFWAAGADRNTLAGLLGLVFHYDAREILEQVENHAVLSRYAARDVVRQLALLLLEERRWIPSDSKRLLPH